MTTEKINIYQEDKVRPAERLWFASKLVQPGFVLVGLAFTVLAFVLVNSVVEQMVTTEYERVSNHQVETAVDTLSDLQMSMDKLSSLLSMYNDVDRQVLAKKARSALQDIEYFDQVLWLYQDKPGQWQAASIYKKESSQSFSTRYEVKLGQTLIKYLTDHDVFSSTDLVIATDLDFVSREISSKASRDVAAAPLALIRSVEANSKAGGAVIAVGSLAHSLSMNAHNEAVQLNIRDIDSGYNLYQNHISYDASASAYSPAYEFIFSGKKWEIKTTLLSDEQVRLLYSLPFFVIVLGLMITAFGTLYIRSNTSRAIQVTRMYKALEHKNAELKEEISKRANLNAALSQAEKENRSIIDAVSDIIFEVDTDGKILFLSAAWQKVTGFSVDQSHALELFTMLHSQDQDAHRKDFQLMVRGQKQAYRSFARLRTSDGTFRAVELAFSMMRQDEDNNMRVVGTITDVEERRRAERALSEAEKKYRAIVENAAGGIYQLTPEGLYLSANPAMARILGYDSPEDMLRRIKNANESVYVDVKGRQSFVRELEKRGVINSYEVQVNRKDGSKIWVNENVRVVKDDNNNTLYYEGSLEDITVRKKSEMAMRDAKVYSDLANRAKSEFLANMSHELRTPLNAIIGFSEIIKNEVFGPIGQESYQEYAKDIHESGQGLLRIINEILDISKIEAGERQLSEGVVDLNKVVVSCMSLISNKIEANKMSVTNALLDVPQVVGEELAIKQIMMNLLSNAIKFTPSGGRVNISAELDEDGQLRVSVTDTGVGLDKDEIAKALSPFGQLDNDLSRSGTGTGLGLTLVDALVKLHGGEFELFSQKGIGTTATVIFPKNRVTVKKASQSRPQTAAIEPTEDA